MASQNNNHPVESIPTNVPLTPMMQQYISIKQNNLDCLLFYRMGDFYELFFQDAALAAETLGIALTKRGKAAGQDIPMCGVPYHASEQYLYKLIKANFKVAICEQIETPEEAKKRGGYKAVVKREVVRIVTPGTLFEDNLLESSQNNNLCSIASSKSDYAISYVDISTGNLNTLTTSISSLEADLARIAPKEILISESLFNDHAIKPLFANTLFTISTRADNLFTVNRTTNQIYNFFNVKNLDGFGKLSNTEIIATGVLLEYLEHTQKLSLPRISFPNKISSSNYLYLDSSTRKNLELNVSINGSKKDSLIKVIDKTLTACGSRLLATYLSSPLCDPASINARLNCVDYFVKNQNQNNNLRTIIKHFPDIERAISRVFSKRGTPKDLSIIRDGLDIASILSTELQKYSSNLPDTVQTLSSQLCVFSDLLNTLSNSLDEDANLLKDGNFIKTGFNASLDKLRDLKSNADQKIIALREEYRSLTDINNLKISRNNVIGYFIDVSPNNSKKIDDDIFIHRQSLGSSIRYTTNELKQLESDLITCDERITSLELEIFQKICNDVIQDIEQLSLIANNVATLDVYTGLATLAIENHYTKPIVDDSDIFIIEKGRHPIVEKSIKQNFITNSCAMQENNIWLITGPNMAGKSTFLRQNALICILAQIGCFVPAEKAHIGVVDKLFSRIGAGDDISRGQSTFMIEMVETANILNNATSKSLIILDEIGRGTATYDGLSIAWSIIENLHNTVKARTLFATHYHELTNLEEQLDNVYCYTANVQEWNEQVIFLHEIVRGKADRSYGIHVAKLAGIPKSVISRANNILVSLQHETHTPNISPSANNNHYSEVEEKISKINVDDMTPQKALNALYELKKMVN